VPSQAYHGLVISVTNALNQTVTTTSHDEEFLLSILGKIQLPPPR